MRKTFVAYNEDNSLFCVYFMHEEDIGLQNVFGYVEISDEELKEQLISNIQNFIHQNGEIVPKPTHNITVSQVGNVITVSNLPTEPYSLFVDMGEPVGLVELTETEFELTDPGDYAVVLKPSFPYAEERHDVAII